MYGIWSCDEPFVSQGIISTLTVFLCSFSFLNCLHRVYKSHIQTAYRADLLFGLWRCEIGGLYFAFIAIQKKEWMLPKSILKVFSASSFLDVWLETFLKNFCSEKFIWVSNRIWVNSGNCSQYWLQQFWGQRQGELQDLVPGEGLTHWKQEQEDSATSTPPPPSFGIFEVQDHTALFKMSLSPLSQSSRSVLLCLTMMAVSDVGLPRQ